MSHHREQLSHPKLRAPELQVRDRFSDPESSMADSPPSSSGHSAETYTPPATSIDRPSTEDSFPLSSPDNGSSYQTSATSDITRPKSKKSVLRFLSLKEPSTSAWEQFAQQQKADANLRGPNWLPSSSKKLPTTVPKVNTRWDGMPKSSHDRSGSGSTKKSTDSSISKETDSWATPRPSSGRSSQVKKPDRDNASAERSISRQLSNTPDQSSLEAQKTRHRTPSPCPRSESDHVAPKMSTESLIRDDELEDFGEGPDMSLTWPSGYQYGQEQPAASGAAETGKSTAQPINGTGQSLPARSASDNSSPYMPQTPEDNDALPTANNTKDAPPPAYTHLRDDSADFGTLWPLPNADAPDASARSSVSSVAPPPIPAKSTRRPSSDSVHQLKSGSGSDSDERRPFDGTSSAEGEVRPGQYHHGAGSFSRPRYPVPEDAPISSNRSSVDSNADSIEAVDIPRFKTQAPPSPLRPNFSRPGSAGRNSSDSIDKSPSPPTSPKSSVRSFSRPIPFNNTLQPQSPASSKQSSSSSMGTISIVRNNQPLYTNTDKITNNKTPLSFVPPRFQPGRVVVKDSDLDTIAESVRTTSTRRSDPSTINADIPSRARQDQPIANDDGASLRTSLYASSSEEGDSDLGATPRRTQSNEHRDSYYATPDDPHDDSGDEAGAEDDNELGPASEAEPRSRGYGYDGADSSGDDTETDEYTITSTHPQGGQPRRGSPQRGPQEVFERLDQRAPREKLDILGQQDPEHSHQLNHTTSQASMASDVSKSWELSSQERLGLGGKVRKSAGEVPWESGRAGGAASTSKKGLLGVFRRG